MPITSPSIVEIPGEPRSDGSEYDARRPFIYRDSVNTVYLGPLGTHHPDVAEFIGVDNYWTDADCYQGMVWTQPIESTPPVDSPFEWYDDPGNQADVEAAILARFPEYDWTASKASPFPKFDQSFNDLWDDSSKFGAAPGQKWHDYYEQVANYARQAIQDEGMGAGEAIDLAFGMITPPSAIENIAADPGPEEIDEIRQRLQLPPKKHPSLPTPHDDVEHLHRPFGRENDYYGWRVPVCYWPDAGQVVTGAPGDFHTDLRLPHGGQKRYDGFIGIQGETGPEGRSYQPGLSWLEVRPSVGQHEKVVQALTPRFPEAANNFAFEGQELDDDFDDLWDDTPAVPVDSRWNDSNPFRLGFAQANGINPIHVSTEDQWLNTSLNQRVPFILHHPSGNLYVGKPGNYHAEIRTSPEYKDFMSKLWDNGPSTDGWAYIDQGTYNHDEAFPDERTEQAVKSYMEGHLRRPLRKETWEDLYG